MDKAGLLYQKLAAIGEYVAATRKIVPTVKELVKSQKTVTIAAKESKAAKNLWEVHGGRPNTFLGDKASIAKNLLKSEKKVRNYLLKQTGKGLVIPGVGLAAGTAGVVATKD